METAPGPLESEAQLLPVTELQPPLKKKEKKPQHSPHSQIIVTSEPELFLLFPSGSTDACLNNGKCSSLWMTEINNNSSFLESDCVSAKALKFQLKQAPTDPFRSWQQLQQWCCWTSHGLQSSVLDSQTLALPVSSL